MGSRTPLELWSVGLLPDVEPVRLSNPAILNPAVPGADPSCLGGDFYESFALCLQQRLPPDVLSALLWFVCQPASEYDTWSSLCAGTDSPALGIAYIRSALALHTTGLRWQPSQLFAAEITPSKQEFLRTAFPGLHMLFGDLKELPSGRAFDLVSGGNVEVPSTRGRIGGFPCQDISQLNFKSTTEANRSVVANSSHRTGSVFNSIIDLECVQVGEWSVYENVRTLGVPPIDTNGKVCGPSNLSVAIWLLRTRAQMWTISFELDPSLFAALTTRSRIWILSIKQHIVSSAGFSDAEITRQATMIMNCIVGNHTARPLDAYLLPESHPIIVGRLRAVSGEVTTGGSGGAMNRYRAPKRALSDPDKPTPRTEKAVGMHFDAYERAGVDWWAGGITEADFDVFPGLRELTEREKEVLEINKITPATADPIVVSVSATLPWVKVKHGTAPCLSSSIRLYIAHRRRLAVGIEHLRFQGIFFDDLHSRHISDRINNTTLVDLAGNSFDMSTFIAVFTVSLSLRALLARKLAVDACAGTPVPVSPGNVFAEVWSDDDSDSSHGFSDA